jgi:nitrate reductase gamma subunit
MNYLNQLAFQIYPYIVIGVFFIGSWARFDRAMYTWRTGSSQMLSGSGMRWGSNLFHVGILMVLGGHLVGLLTPHWVYSAFLSAPQKQVLAMVVGGVFGGLCLIGLLILLTRRLTNPRVRATGTTSDTVVLVLLLAQLLLGLGTIAVSAGHPDGSVMMALAEWAQHVVTFRWGAAELIADVSWVYKLHLFLGMTLFLIAPFTRLVHVWSIPFSYLWRPYQIVRRRAAPLFYGPRSDAQ